MKIPCKDCILIAICRHKNFRPMLYECEPLRNILYRPWVIKNGVRNTQIDTRLRADDFMENVTEVESIIKPVRWQALVLHDGFASITQRQE